MGSSFSWEAVRRGEKKIPEGEIKTVKKKVSIKGRREGHQLYFFPGRGCQSKNRTSSDCQVSERWGTEKKSGAGGAQAVGGKKLT